MRTETDYAYIRDIILVLKRVTRMMPDELPEVNTEKYLEFELQVLTAEAQVLKLKAELSLR